MFKNTNRVVFATIMVVLLFCRFSSFGVAGACPDGEKDSKWHEKMRAEKVAFFTSEMELTSEEAQVFWPVYNAADKERHAAFGSQMKAYKALKAAVEQGSSEKEISVLIEKYIEAQKVVSTLDSKYLPQFRKVLPVEKVAKLYIAEEKYRRMQIGRLHSPETRRDSDKSSESK